jgi:hypothetical protein
MEERRLLRPLELSNFFDELFFLFRNNFWLFTGIAGFAYIPILTIISLIWGLAGMNIGQFVIIILQPLIIGAGTYAISKRYLGEPCTVMEAYKAVFRRFFPFLWTIIVANLYIILGTYALIFPGIILFYWYAFVTQVFVLEGLSYKDARTRSRQITEGQWWRILVVTLLFGLIQGTAQQILSLPIAAAPFLATRFGETGPMWAIVGLYTGLTTALAMVMQLIISVLLYYDLRVRKEGFDLELLAKEIERSSPPQQTI